MRLSGEHLVVENRDARRNSAEAPVVRTDDAGHPRPVIVRKSERLAREVSLLHDPAPQGWMHDVDLSVDHSDDDAGPVVAGTGAKNRRADERTAYAHLANEP